jgi:heme exporter protein D
MMPDLGPHAGFIIVSYVVAAAVMAMLVAWVILDHRSQRRRLAALEARGVRRRSAATAVNEPGAREPRGEGSESLS